MRLRVAMPVHPHFRDFAVFRLAEHRPAGVHPVAGAAAAISAAELGGEPGPRLVQLSRPERDLRLVQGDVLPVVADGIDADALVAERGGEEHGFGRERGGDRVHVPPLPAPAKRFEQRAIGLAHGAQYTAIWNRGSERMVDGSAFVIQNSESSNQEVATMLKRVLACTAVLALCALPLAAQGHAATAGNEMTITGQVVDLNCFTTNGQSGAGHKACAQACAKAGVPLGVLSSDGTIYVPVSSKPGDPQNSKLEQFIEAKVKVTGMHRMVSGLHTIEIKTVSIVWRPLTMRCIPVTFTLASMNCSSFEFCGSPGLELTGT